MPRLSIIVPIYNVESYVGQCLESIRKQTFQDWECLLFSDGSKDGSINIMRSFAAEDDRFKIIEKQNEGYGTTCNRGIDMARGEWISIVEPDDFIDPHMYERLLSDTTSENGTVDIVKGSYWLYYDGRDGYTDALQSPNLANAMPARRMEFSLEEFPEPFYHHPSIWSAVYRKEFLDGQNKSSMKIRFEPIPGGGWADNPFFAQTMVLADRIVWTPGKYYYYRQTNPGASTFIKDYHLPFDRLRDMREFLEGQHVSKEIMRVFYSREFDYVTSVIGEYGFDDKNEDVRALIREVFESMDRKEVFLMADRLRPEFLDYYMDFMGDSYEIHNHADVPQPALSVVLFTHDARSWVVDTFEAYSSFKNLPVEFVVVDAGSQDSTVTVAKEFAQKDKRFIIKEMDTDATTPELVDAAMNVARGEYIVFVPSHFTVGEGFLRAALAGARRSHADVALLDAGNIHCDYLIEKLAAKGVPAKAFMDDPRSVRGPIYGPFTATEIPELAISTDRDYSWHKIYRTAFLRDSAITAGEHDIFDNLLEFGGRALLASGNIAFLDMKTGWDVRDIQRKQIPSSFWLALEKPIPYTSEPDTDIDSVLSLGIWLKDNNLYETYEQSYLNTLLSSFMFGVSTRYSPEGIVDFLERYLGETEKQLDIRAHGALYFYDIDAFNAFQKITLHDRSLDLWLMERALRDEDIIFARDKEIQDIHRSARFMFGEKAIDLVKTISPTSLIARAQEQARKLKRG